MSYLKIGELARRTGATNETLRFYETRGLLESPRRTEAGYRLYAEADVARVRFILRSRRMGFSLKDIKELLLIRVDREHNTCGDVKQLAEIKLQDINARIAELNQVKAALEKVTDACCGGDLSAVHCSILDELDAESA